MWLAHYIGKFEGGQEDQYDDDDGRSMYSNVTVDNLDAAVPQIDSAEYVLYIKSVLKMLVGELCVLEWAERGESNVFPLMIMQLYL